MKKLCPARPPPARPVAWPPRPPTPPATTSWAAGSSTVFSVRTATAENFAKKIRRRL
ncbi:hypothetical protein ACRAWD_26370 [Caulobacter segnis]